MNRDFFLMIFLFFFGAAFSAQTQSLTISKVPGCSEQEVLLPVTAKNLSDIGSITLFFQFESSNLTYISLLNIDPQLEELIHYNYISNPPRLNVVWSNTDPANFYDSKFFDLNFHYTGDLCPVTFGEGCEIANTSFEILPVTYINGQVEPGDPVITYQPGNITIKAGENASFQIVASNADGYAWNESKDQGLNWNTLEDGSRYMGTNTQQMTITGVPVSYSNNQYKCIINHADCSRVSENAILSVDSNMAINELQGNGLCLLQNKPNPFSESTIIEFYLPEDGIVKLNLLNPLGKLLDVLMESILTKGMYSIAYNGYTLPKGIYLCQLEFDNESTHKSTYHKLIKT